MPVLISDNGQVVRGGGAGAQSRLVETCRWIVRGRFLSDREPDGGREIGQVLVLVEAIVGGGSRHCGIHLPDTGHQQEAGLLDLLQFSKW